MEETTDTRFKITLKCTSNTNRFRITSIPFNLTPDSRYLLTGIMGKTKNNSHNIFIHCPELSNQNQYLNIGGVEYNDLIGSNVLTTTPSKPTNRVASLMDIGHPCPSFLEYNPNLTIYIKDENGTLITDSDIDYIFVSIEIFNR